MYIQAKQERGILLLSDKSKFQSIRKPLQRAQRDLEVFCIAMLQDAQRQLLLEKVGFLLLHVVLKSNYEISKCRVVALVAWLRRLLSIS